MPPVHTTHRAVIRQVVLNISLTLEGQELLAAAVALGAAKSPRGLVMWCNAYQSDNRKPAAMRAAAVELGKLVVETILAGAEWDHDHERGTCSICQTLAGHPPEFLRGDVEP